MARKPNLRKEAKPLSISTSKEESARLADLNFSATQLEEAYATILV